MAPPPAVSRRPAISILPNSGADRLQHQARHALVADQDIGALPEQAHVEPFLLRAFDQGDQLVGVFRLGEVFGRAAQLEPGVHRQRLSLPHNLLKAAQESHDQSSSSMSPLPSGEG